MQEVLHGLGMTSRRKLAQYIVRKKRLRAPGTTPVHSPTFLGPPLRKKCTSTVEMLVASILVHRHVIFEMRRGIRYSRAWKEARVVRRGLTKAVVATNPGRGYGRIRACKIQKTIQLTLTGCAVVKVLIHNIPAALLGLDPLPQSSLDLLFE
jgi:hypothetical protein